MPLLRYALRRIGQTLPVALLVTVLIFFLIKLLPGDPATAVLGDRASVQAVQALHKQWGLDRPLPVQYAVYMALLSAVPEVGGPRREPAPIEGEPPSAVRVPSGCRFHPRCPSRVERCPQESPALDELLPHHLVACHVAADRLAPARAGDD